MNCALYVNNSPTNAMTKDLNPIVEYNIELKDSNSITDISIIIAEPNAEKIILSNYCHIPLLGRYYFIMDITNIKQGVWQLDLHCDVLMSFRERILAHTAVIARQEKEFDVLLNDELYKLNQNPVVTTRKFPKGFGTPSFVLAVAGD